MTSTPMEISQIEIARIDATDRLRTVKPARVAEMKVSIKDRGLLQPIEVRPEGEKFRLVMGAHRLAAARELGWTHIAAATFPGDALEAELREIDENLYRAELDPLDQAVFMARRREIFETKSGAIKRGRPRLTEIVPDWRNKSFHDEMATIFGMSRRQVERALTRYAKMLPAVRIALQASQIDFTGVEIDALCAMGADEQADVVAQLRNGRPDGKAVSLGWAIGVVQAVPAKQAPTPLAHLLKAWEVAPKAVKRMFLQQLEAAGQIKDLLK